jgi:hypothetical protein
MRKTQQEIIDKNKYEALEVLKNFPLFCSHEKLKEMISDYEQYRETVRMPGDALVVGYDIGEALINFSNFSEFQPIGDRTRLVRGFELSGQAENHELLTSSLELFDNDRFVGWKKRTLIETFSGIDGVSTFLEKNSGIRFSVVCAVGLGDDELDKLNSFIMRYTVPGAEIYIR